IHRSRWALRIAPLLIIALATPASLKAQITQDQAADMLLTAARKAHNDKNHAFAAAKFREFLGKFGQHKEVNAARYGLALCLIDGADKNYAEARDLLQNVANSKDFADRHYALYYLGLAWRGLGLGELALADKNPNEAVNRRATAQKHFEQAA